SLPAAGGRGAGDDPGPHALRKRIPLGSPVRGGLRRAGLPRAAAELPGCLRANERECRTPPLGQTCPQALGEPAPFLDQWLAPEEPDDPYWREMRVATGLAGADGAARRMVRRRARPDP